jgi:hypothetical protein
VRELVEAVVPVLEQAQPWEQGQVPVEAVVLALGQALEQDQDHRPWSPLLASNAQHASTRQRRCGHFDHRN